MLRPRERVPPVLNPLSYPRTPTPTTEDEGHPKKEEGSGASDLPQSHPGRTRPSVVGKFLPGELLGRGLPHDYLLGSGQRTTTPTDLSLHVPKTTGPRAAHDPG